MTDYVFTYPTIVGKAKEIKKTVEKEYKLPYSTPVYYIAKAILKPKQNIKKITVNKAEKNSGDYFSRQIYHSTYIDMAERLVKYVEKNNQLPNTILDNHGKKMRVSDYVYMFARILVYYNTNGKYPKYANVNSKAFTKPTETGNEVYDYFVKTFGKITCIDDALDYIDRKGYGYYYDDVYSNKETINRMKQGKGVNCTDSCHVFYNLGLAFVKQGKYKKVECLHVRCQGGDGHVRLRFTLPNGEKFYRDPACTLSDGGVCNWCMNGTLLAIDPSWFMANLNR